MRIQRGDTRGSGPPLLKNHKIKVFLAKLVRIPCKTTKLTSQNSVLGHHRPASNTPFRWRTNNGPLTVLFRSSLPKSTKNSQKWTPLKKLSGSAHVSLCDNCHLFHGFTLYYYSFSSVVCYCTFTSYTYGSHAVYIMYTCTYILLHALLKHCYWFYTMHDWVLAKKRHKHLTS